MAEVEVILCTLTTPFTFVLAERSLLLTVMHSFLLTGDDLPECGTCQCPLTVKLILVECVDLKDVRNKHFVASSVKDLFDNIEAHKIIDFIKETCFYKQL